MIKLRFGIMVDGDSLKRWQFNAIQQMIDAEVAEPVLIIRNSSPAGNPPLMEMMKNGLFYVFKKFFAKTSALDSMPFPDYLTKAELMECSVTRKGEFSEYFLEKDLASIESKNLDFILRFGFGIIRGKIHEVTKYGIWSFHHGDEQKYRGGPYCFWEVYYQDRLTGSILQRLTNKLDGGIVLKKGQFGTVLHSYGSNIEQALTASSEWPKQVCIDLLNGITEALDAPPSTTTAPIYKNPSNFQMLRLLVIQSLAFAQHWYKKITEWDLWGIGVVTVPIEDVINHSGIRPEWVDWWPKQPNCIMADPSIHLINGEDYLLYEKLDQDGHLGYLVASPFSSKQKSEILLEESFHLSYPRIIKDRNQVVLIPEANESGKVLSYKQNGALGNWDKPVTLIEGVKGIDPTVFKHDGKWWMFLTELGKGHQQRLLVYHANELLGPWIAHGNNPVKSDVRCARAGGGVFEHDGSLIRPGQDYSVGNEGALNLYRITELTESTYQEEHICFIGPIVDSPYPHKIHTVDVAHGKIVIDSCKVVNVFVQPKWFMSKLKLFKHKG